MNTNKFCVVITTTDKESNAHDIVRSIMDAKLSRCIQIDSLQSHYIWQDDLHQSKEYRIAIKALVSNYCAIEAAILRVHNYKLPQILRLDIAGGFQPYMSWLGGAEQD